MKLTRPRCRSAWAGAVQRVHVVREPLICGGVVLSGPAVISCLIIRNFGD